MLTTLLASIVLTLPAAPAMHAQDAAKPAAAKADAKPERLMPGMAAPKLDVKEFIKGSAIDGFQAGQVYVVEFWATWCGPCIRAFPHLSELQKELGLSYLFIAHNLGVVEHLCDRIAVMYLGKIVESAPAAELFKEPSHPYTRALLSAVPEPDRRERRDRIILEGDVPSPLNPPTGCSFHPRCREIATACSATTPSLISLDQAGTRRVSCLRRGPDAI